MKLEILKELIDAIRPASRSGVRIAPKWSMTIKPVKRCKYKPSMGWTGKWK